MNRYIDEIQIKKSNRIATLHPFVKFIMSVIFVTIILILETIKNTRYAISILLIPTFLLLLALIILSGVWNTVVKQIRAVVLLSLLIFLLQSVTVTNGPLILQFLFLNVHRDGISNGYFLGFIILNIATVFIWLFGVTTNDEITATLQQMNFNYRAVYVFAATLRMVTVLTKRSKGIVQSQKARGIEQKGRPDIRIKSFFSSIVPLIIGSLIEAEERSLALEARGFSIDGPKTNLVKLKYSGDESLALGISLMVFGAVLIGRSLL